MTLSLMSESEFFQQMAEYSFKKIGDIELVDNYPKFTNTRFDDNHGFVYLWVQKRNKSYSIVYVGKAGKYLKNRCQQHMAGFRKSTTGQNHAKRFNSSFTDNAAFELYARKSEVKDLLGEKALPMECVEEIAFIRKFKPEWNST